MAGLVVLSLATGIQIGGVYFLVLWLVTLAGTVRAREKFPFGPMAAMTFIPAVLVGLVVFAFPHLWNGFLEHARQTPSLTGLRMPQPSDILKLLRTLPGILAVGALMPWWFKGHQEGQSTLGALELITIACTATSLGISFASMFFLTANSVFFVAWLQPLVVAGCLAILKKTNRPTLVRSLGVAFLILAFVGAIRAIGMSTWGIACAADVSYGKAISEVRKQLNDCPSQSTAVLSSAYLYEGIQHKNVRLLHSDWLAPAQRGGPNRDLEALTSVKPAKLILTQFDFYRRYEPLVAELKSHPESVVLDLRNTAGVPPPDSISSLRKVVQHISWAPIIVTFTWK